MNSKVISTINNCYICRCVYDLLNCPISDYTDTVKFGNVSATAYCVQPSKPGTGSGDAFSGANSTAKNLAMKLYNYCVSQPEIPDVAMSFPDVNVKAYVDGNSQRTKFYAGQNVEVVFSNVTFTNDRQKADVNVVKKDNCWKNMCRECML